MGKATEEKLFAKSLQQEAWDALRGWPPPIPRTGPAPTPKVTTTTPKRVEVQVGAVTLSFAETTRGIRCVSKIAPAGVSTFIPKAQFTAAVKKAVEEFVKRRQEGKRVPRLQQRLLDF